jgi:hypothetical protein
MSSVSRIIRYFSSLLASLLFVACGGCSSTSATFAPTARAQGPCDLYASATPCVAAFSTTRALYAAYSGPLYQVTRASDATTMNIGLLSDGYANAASQDFFCINTTCTITTIYDQSSGRNDLIVSPPGGAARGAGPNGYDLPAVANALPVMAGGHNVYGISINSGMGYRNDATKGIAVNAQPEGVYMVTSTFHLNNKCCFDFGNAEVNNKDNGKGHMDAINMSCAGSPCTSYSPGLDLEKGTYSSLTVAPGTVFVTDMASNDGLQYYTLWNGNAQSGSLSTIGTTALPSGYSPMKLEGAIILGTGGDNSDGDSGEFFEGVMTIGAPTASVMSSVQDNIVAAGYR